MDENNRMKIQDFCKNLSFLQFMRMTQKYKELKSGESIGSFLLALFVTVIFWLWVSNDYFRIIIINNIIAAIAPIIIPASIGNIGFLFAGIAIMASIMDRKAIDIIDSEGKIQAVAGILFSFYFCGALIAAELFMYSILGMSILWKIYYYKEMLYWLILFLSVYTTIYSLVYTISLLGSCIKFFFVNVYYNHKKIK